MAELLLWENTLNDPIQAFSRVLWRDELLFLLSPGKQVRTKLSQAFNHWLNVPEDKLQVRALKHPQLCLIELDSPAQVFT